MKGKQARSEIDELDKHEFIIKLHRLGLSSDDSLASLIQVRRVE